MAKHDTYFRAAAIVQRSELLSVLPPSQRQAFIRFLARGENRRDASPELSGAFACHGLSPFETAGKE